MNRMAVRRVIFGGLTVTLCALLFSAATTTARGSVPASTDVLFLFDTTGSMGGALGEAQSQAAQVMTNLTGTLPNIRFGVAEVKDYDSDSPYPWRVDQGLTSNQGDVQTAINALSAYGGGDSPEAYGSALYQATHDSAVGWSPTAKHLVVLIADDVPHDNDLNEGVPSDIVNQPSPWDTGADPGPTGVGTIDWQQELAAFKASGYTLAFVLYHGVPSYLPYWNWWAGLTGGAAVDSSGSLGDTLTSIISTTAHGGGTEVTFGDSVAAGEGLGADSGYPDNPGAYSALVANTLGMTSYNYAISGACASTKKAGSSHTDDQCSDVKSIMTTQIPNAKANGPKSADLVTITVGADDIHFSDCFLALAYQFAGKTPGPDPCSNGQLNDHLKGLAANLGTVLQTVKAMYPTAKIVVTGYYNPLPPAIANSTGLCPVYGWLYAAAQYEKNQVPGMLYDLALHHFDDHVVDFQTQLATFSSQVLGQLNNTIRTVAAANGATYASVDFSGHDFCHAYSQVGGTSYVFAPKAIGSITVNSGPIHVFRDFEFDPQDKCTPQQPHPACNVRDLPAVSDTGKFNVHGVSGTYTANLFGQINDFPHPTAAGQSAIASAIKGASGL